MMTMMTMMTMSNMFNLIQSVLPNLSSVFRNAGRCEADLRPATAFAGHMALAGDVGRWVDITKANIGLYVTA